MADVPQLAWPLRFVGGQAATIEQDSIEEIALCVETILRYRVGERPEAPDFGTPDPAFGQAPLDLEQIRAAILEWEPRAHLLLDQQQGAGANQLDTIINATVGGADLG